MYWCFATINGRLGEIYFDKKNGQTKISGHCYVKKEDFTIKGGLRALNQESEEFKIVYRNKKYKIIRK